MLKIIESYILRNKLLSANAKVIVGISGGADSVALLHILKTLGYQCIVAHCNFHLRGEESDRDELFVQKLASNFALDFHKIDFETTNFALNQKISIEMAARDLRYQWFEELRLKLDAEVIAVAHHADDNVETLLMNLTRGTGLRGMTGIPVRNGKIIRPLLAISRTEIINYLKSNNLEFVTDSTNIENKYIRNRFRNEIIPAFEAINPSFRSTINETIERFEEIEAIYNEHISFLKKQIVFEKGNTVIIDTLALRKCKYAKTILYEILFPMNFNKESLIQILNSMDYSPGALFYSPTHQLLHDRDKFIVTQIESVDFTEYIINKTDTEILSPIHLGFTYKNNNGIINKNPNIAMLDADKVKFPLVLRHWRKSDSFVPFGMKTRKKISDFFIDTKVNRFEKEQIWLLLSEKNIVWIVGNRIDNRFCIDKNTSKVIEIQLLN